jgi:hypothetical protein
VDPEFVLIVEFGDEEEVVTVPNIVTFPLKRRVPPFSVKEEEFPPIQLADPIERVAPALTVVPP